MAGFNLPFKFPFKKAQNNSGVAPSIKSTQPVILKPSAKVQNGTTAYLKAQELLLSAQNKLKQRQPQYETELK
jgi:hypothetical protein